MQSAGESLKCCTCTLEGAVCIPLHASSGFNSQVVCCSVYRMTMCAAVVSVVKQKASSTGRDTNTLTHFDTAQYTLSCSHLYCSCIPCVQLLKLIEQGLHASRSAFEHYCGCSVYTEGFHSLGRAAQCIKAWGTAQFPLRPCACTAHHCQHVAK